MDGQQLVQVCLGSAPGIFASATSQNLSPSFLGNEEIKFRNKLLNLCPENLWHNGSYAAGCPRPILVGNHHLQQMQDLHEALTIAIIDIVQRWWIDTQAQFPQRMPLQPEEEELLIWIESQVKIGILPDFAKRLGSWRPDFLVEEDDNHEESFRITEINARFSFNGFIHEAYGQEATNQSLKGHEDELVGATDPSMILDGLFNLFRREHPLHLLKGEENGIDIHMFVDVVRRRFGVTPRLITPADLRLLSDASSRTGYRLCCVAEKGAPTGFEAANGEIWEEIHQVGLELHQRELAAMERQMLREVSLRCFNDMRTILLVHDKRMLGIVKQEIPHLVASEVLTPAQGKALDRGIVDTILPGSQQLRGLIQTSISDPRLRFSYILKPIRSGKGDGIVFGEDLREDEWTSALRKLISPEVVPGVTCVAQRRVIPREYDLVLKGTDGNVRYPLVGTYHVVNGQLLGLGTWRASGGRIVAVSSGGSWICSVTRSQ
ncbi:hypothetical protein CkaCkLH20_08626 [Colletotrichum karsti]|uniref:Uncharacterized protein n=1 Tax=Colletotrichum karsti TaxID=1095194 RepID=A0A9P6I153_9PEZI|nr:uncharacterized protein CkaCkLH20_08626 [Colletotrichum karsti]KAF9873892.1 hypothetical protein CkaCkLH20_08626 [Colletotrichum karsti]